MQSIVQRPNQDGRTTSSSLAQSPQRGTTPTSVHAEIPLQEQPLFGPQRPEEMANNTTESQINTHLRTVKRQVELAKEQSQRISKL